MEMLMVYQDCHCNLKFMIRDDDDDVFYTSQIEQLPVTNAEIKRETQREKVLSRVLENVHNGRASPLDNPLLKAFYNRKNE